MKNKQTSAGTWRGAHLLGQFEELGYRVMVYSTPDTLHVSVSILGDQRENNTGLLQLQLPRGPLKGVQKGEFPSQSQSKPKGRSRRRQLPPEPRLKRGEKLVGVEAKEVVKASVRTAPSRPTIEV